MTSIRDDVRYALRARIARPRYSFVSIATLIPAVRFTRLDPARTLRGD